MGVESWYRWEGDGLWLTLLVQPRASRDEMVGPHGDAFRVRITAPPLDGKANAHLIRFLAKGFGVPKARVTLESGETARRKTFLISSPTRHPAGCNVK